MSDQFTEALDQTEETQETYANQLGIKPEKIPFTAETLPDAGIAVRTNQDLLNEVASHILNRAGHISIIDERGAGKSHFRDLVYDALSEGPRSEEFRVARIREVESITTRRFYTRLLDELSEYDDLEIPESYPHATDEVRQLVEEVAEQLESLNIACIIQVDQLEDAARNTRTFEQLLPRCRASVTLEKVNQYSFSSYSELNVLVIELTNCVRRSVRDSSQRIERWNGSDSQKPRNSSPGGSPGPVKKSTILDIRQTPTRRDAIRTIVEVSDGTPRDTRQKCYHAFRAGAQQFAAERDVEITNETLDAYL